MESLSFNGITDLYDETRVFDKDCFDSSLDFIVERFPPSTFGKLFEPGVGTGRIAIPLAMRGYQVTGVDISEEMLESLKNRLSQAKQPLSISLRKANAMELPFHDASFDIAVVVHLFYFIEQWKKAVGEIFRVLKEGSPLVVMHTGTGAEVPSLNSRYKELCAEQGHSIKDIGVKSTNEVVDYLINIGCHVEQIRDRWQWAHRIQVSRALDYIRSRAYSFTMSCPNNVHFKAIEQLEYELQQQFGNLTTEIEVPNQVYLVLALHP